MLILPIYLNQVLNNEKVKNQKKLFLTQSSGPQRNLKQLFFCANSKSKIVASVHCAYASKDKMVRIWHTLKKKNFLFQPSKNPQKSHTWAPLKVPKCEIFHLFDFNDLYVIKAL